MPKHYRRVHVYMYIHVKFFHASLSRVMLLMQNVGESLYMYFTNPSGWCIFLVGLIVTSQTAVESIIHAISISKGREAPPLSAVHEIARQENSFQQRWEIPILSWV